MPYPDPDTGVGGGIGGMLPRSSQPGLSRLRRFGRQVAGGLQNVDLYGAYLAGRGKDQLLAQRRDEQAAVRRAEETAQRRAAALRELEAGGFDPTTPEGYRDAWSVFYRYGLTDDMERLDALYKNTRAEEEAGGPASYTTAEGVFVRDPSVPGGYRNAGKPNNAPLVTIGGSGLDPNQAIGAEDRARAETATRTQQYRDKVDRFRQLQALYARIKSEKRSANPAETDTIVKLAARIENPEAVNESDVYRKAGGSLWNVARAWGGLPPELDDAQLDAIYGVAGAIAQDAEAQLGEIEGSARATAAGRGLNPEAVAPSGPKAPKPPAGAKPHPTLHNVWVLPDGSGWTP